MSPSTSAARPAETDPMVPTGAAPRRRGFAGSQVAGLLRATHPKQTLVTAVALTVVAALAGRPARELGLVFVTVLVGQVLLAWHNDVTDAERDARHEVPGKPVAEGTVEAGNAWFAIAVAVLLVIPLSISSGVLPGLCYLASLALGMVANTGVRRTPASWLPWAAAFALYPPFLGAGGWGGEDRPDPVSWSMVGLFAAAGLLVHIARSLPGLVADHADGWKSLPLLLATRTGATKLLVVCVVLAVALLVATALVGSSTGLGGATLG